MAEKFSVKNVPKKNTRKPAYKVVRLEKFIGKQVDKKMLEEDDLIDEDDGDCGFCFSVGFLPQGAVEPEKSKKEKDWEGESCWVEFFCDKDNKIESLERTLEGSKRSGSVIKSFDNQETEKEAIEFLEKYLL